SGDPALSGVSALAGSAYLAVRASQADARTVARLVNSVLRPLAGALPETQEPQTPYEHQTPHEPLAGQETLAPQERVPSLWDLAVSATSLRARLAAGAPPGLLEAVAALQEPAIRQAPA